MAQREFTLSELSEAAGVSGRTVRYYITEGLLPPPVVAGPRSSYSHAHLNRLMLIGRLKNAYLPLREIRKRLDGLSDPEIETMLQQNAGLEQLSASMDSEMLQEDATSSISLALEQSPIRHFRPRSPAASPGSSVFQFPLESEETVEPYDDSLLPPHPSMDRTASNAVRSESVTWRRIELGPDAELLIREDAYDRKRDRVEWLINWAKRVFN